MALREAERRIRSIALVHEILSREAGDQVEFNDILPSLVRMAEDNLLTDRHVGIKVKGEAGELPAEIATPLAVVLTELLQNAVEHAFPDSFVMEEEGHVDVELENDGSELVVRVCDNGIGLPLAFSVEATKSLGLSIVRDLVCTQLNGSIAMRSDHGTEAELRIPTVRHAP